jgi:uncharacterized OsmC-like protein
MDVDAPASAGLGGRERDVEFAVAGDVPKDQIQRAIDLSHEKYCSVWHSMRQDIAFDTRFSVSA